MNKDSIAQLINDKLDVGHVISEKLSEFANKYHLSADQIEIKLGYCGGTKIGVLLQVKI